MTKIKLNEKENYEEINSESSITSNKDIRIHGSYGLPIVGVLKYVGYLVGIDAVINGDKNIENILLGGAVVAFTSFCEYLFRDISLKNENLDAYRTLEKQIKNLESKIKGE